MTAFFAGYFEMLRKIKWIVAITVALFAGYLWGAHWANLESFRIGYDLGYYSGASDKECDEIGQNRKTVTNY